MKILFVTDRLGSGGLETHLLAYFSQLRRAGCRVTLASDVSEHSPYRHDFEQAVDAMHPLRLSGKPAGDILNVKARVVEIAEDEGFDILHAHPFASIYGAFLASVTVSRPLVVTLHGRVSVYAPAILSPLAFTHGVCRHAEVITVNRSLARSASLPAKTHYLPNPVDTEIWRPAPPAADANVLLFVSRLSDDKTPGLVRGIETVASMVRERFPGMKLMVAGDGENAGALASRFPEVEFTGYKKDAELRALMAGAFAVFGMGRVVLEALSVGRPVFLLNYEGAITPLDAVAAATAEEHNFNGSGLAETDCPALGDRIEAAFRGRGETVPSEFMAKFHSSRIVSEYVSICENARKQFAGVTDEARLDADMLERLLRADTKAGDATDIADGVAEEAAAARRAVKDLESSIAAQTAQVASRDATIMELERRLDESAASLHWHQQKLGTTTNAVEALEVRARDLEALVQTQRREMETTISARDDLSADLRRQIDEQRWLIEHQKEQIAALRTDTEQRVAALTGREHELAALSAQVGNLAGHLHERDGRLSALAAELIEERRGVEKLRAKAAAIEVRSRELTRRARALDKERSAAAAALAESEREVRSLRERIRDGSAEIARMGAELDSLRKQNGEMEAALDWFRKEHFTLETAAQDNKALAEALKAEAASHRARLDEIYGGNFWKVARRYYWARDNIPVLNRTYHLVKGLGRSLSAGKPVVATSAVVPAPSGDAPAAPLQAPAATDGIHDFLTAHRERRLYVVYAAVRFVDTEGQRSVRIAQELIKAGNSVLYVYWNWGDADREVYGEITPGLFALCKDDFLARYRDVLAFAGRVSQKPHVLLLEFPDPATAPVLVDTNSNRGCSVYDILDDWEEFHKVGQAPWYKKDAEQFILRNSTYRFAVSRSLADKFGDFDVQLLPNGYCPELLADQPALEIERGKVTAGYFGHLTDAWFDWALVKETARDNPDVVFHIIGYGMPDNLELPANVHYHGKVHPNKLSGYAKSWDVCIIPFKDGELSLAVDPIKLYEYLYFGKPVVVTGLRHLKGTPGVRVCDNAAPDFARALAGAARARFNAPRASRYIADKTWENRVSRLVRFVEEGVQ